MLSHTGHVMTLANSIIGVGILAMPFCFQKCGIVLSILLLIVSNWITRICCHYLIKTSLLTRRKSMEFLGFHAFGFSGKLLVELCVIGYLLGSCITYFVVVGDLGPQIVRDLFSLDGGHIHLRTILMIVVTVVCIIPLGMLKNVDSLSMVCTASIGFYVCLVIKIVLESGEHVMANDWPAKVLYWEPAGVLQCLPIFSMALSCQMQLFEVFQSVNNQSLEKLNGIVRNATWICTLVYIAVGFFGYVAFCTQIFSGNILMNFPASFSSYIIEIGFILSVAFSFPLVIFPCRASIYSLLYRKGHDTTGYIPDSRFKLITVFIVVFSLCIALIIPSVELVIGLVGSTIGVAICIMFPAACFRKIIKKDSTERSLGQFILVAGFCLMILGTYANLSAIDEKRSGVHVESSGEHLGAPAAIIATPDSLKILEAQLLKDLKKELKVEGVKIQEPPPKEMKLAEVASMVMSPPPLPVDEVHKSESEEKLVLVAKPPEKPSSPASPVKEVEKPKQVAPNVLASSTQATGKEKKDPLNNNNSEKKDIPEKKELSEKKDIPEKRNIPAKNDLPSNNNENERKVPSEAKDQPVSKDTPSAPAQTINNEAIKKEEEVAAEEQKAKPTASSNVDELKKTRIELKETKELLERTVDELKQELAKQNQETQNLVAEKLEKVVEKVEKLEQKVEPMSGEAQKPVALANDTAKRVAVEASPAAVRPEAKAGVQLEEIDNKRQKGSLLSILKDNSSAKIYEPLSYKTGELVETARNSSKTDQRLPLPLALLINAAQAKMNATVAGPLPSPANPVAKKEAVKIPPQVAESEAKAAEKIANEADKQKENVEAIRRDILQVNTQREDVEALRTQREKRSVVEAECGSCLKEPIIESIMANGVGGAIELNSHSIAGRELLQVTEEKQEAQKD